MSKKNPYGLTTGQLERLRGVRRHMIGRCTEETHKSYKDYGGRGISVCDEWMNSFDAFVRWALGSGYERGLTIERIDVNGDYCPENCTWLDKKAQSRNTRRNIYITMNGETKCLSEWCEILGISYTKAKQRYDVGITDFETLFYPGDLRELRPHILQYNSNGEFIAEYARIRDAANATGLSQDSIGSALYGNCKTAGGYTWKYKKDKHN